LTGLQADGIMGLSNNKSWLNIFDVA